MERGVEILTPTPTPPISPRWAGLAAGDGRNGRNMAGAKRNKNLHLSEGVIALLRRTGNASAYIEASIAARIPRAERAVRFLRRAGWSESEIREAAREITAHDNMTVELAIEIVAQELAAGNRGIELMLEDADTD